MTKVRDLDQVLDVAARLFGERGYEATPLDEVARELGVLKGSLYYYISSKADLLDLLNRRRLEELIEAAAEVSRLQAPVEARLERILRAHLRSIDQFSPESSQWFVRVAAKKRPTPRAERRSTAELSPWTLHHQYEDLIRQLIVEGMSAGAFRPDLDAQVATLGILGACNWLTHWYRRGGRLTIDEVAESLLALLLDGLRLPPSVGGMQRRVRKIAPKR